MSSETALERIARAWDALGPLDMANYQDRQRAARAALTALREPDEAMDQAMRRTDTFVQHGTSYRVIFKDGLTHWQAAIDAALQEGQ